MLLLLTLLEAEAKRRDGRQSLIIGSGISVRPPGADRAVGYFVNLLPVILNRRKRADAGVARFAPRRPHSPRPWSMETIPPVCSIGNFGSGIHMAPAFPDVAIRHRPDRPYRLAHAATPIPGLVGAEPIAGRAVARPAAGLDLVFSYEPVEDHGGGLELELCGTGRLQTDRRRMRG